MAHADRALGAAAALRRRAAERPVRPLGAHAHVPRSDPDGTLIADRVDYRMPFGVLGAAAHRLLIGRDLERIFDYRRDALARLLTARR